MLLPLVDVVILPRVCKYQYRAYEILSKATVGKFSDMKYSGYTVPANAFEAFGKIDVWKVLAAVHSQQFFYLRTEGIIDYGPFTT